jgi:DNA-binding CsgD family transcriptional regulator
VRRPHAAGPRAGRTARRRRPPPAPPASGRDTLTPSELRIADLAGAGQSNRQIAQRLFITQKTVETHLAHAFRKLHIDSRAQIPAALTR